MDTTNLSNIANELRMLCADMVQEANSGHPGAPLGLADIAVMLARHINTYPQKSDWINRDRLVLSGGHASALLYSMLHLWGYDISLQDLKEFRKLDSKTPGHPEYKHTHGVEITTGPLGQGIANAVGFAMASKRASHILGDKVINHKVYCICGDGDLQEGISYEACSLAGVHNLSNLVIIYDSNNISIEGDVNIAFRENIRGRFESQGFFVMEINGHDFNEIESAFTTLKNVSKPTLIIAHTKIAKNAHSLEGSHHAHGAPLGDEVISKTKENLGLSKEKFVISNALKSHFAKTAENGEQAYLAWEKEIGDSKNLLESINNFSSVEYPTFSIGNRSEIANLDSKNSIATRSSNGQILNAIAKANAYFIGGSADLAPSNNTHIKHEKDYPFGSNMHFGIREHAMGAICNAFANYGIFTPYCATFFVFSDYLSPSIRVASIMKSRVFYIFTHDSIGVGEDGATHQPIEQLSHLRAMPNLLNWRVADANENVCAWQNALEIQAPQSFILTRQNLPLIESSLITKENVAKGGYVISKSSLDSNNPTLSLVASGSEVHLAIKAQKILENLESAEGIDSKLLEKFKGKKGIATQVVSLPCYDLFVRDSAYCRVVFKDSKVLGIEALRALELYRFCDSVICMDSFGSSGKGDLLFKKYGFDVANVCSRALELLDS